MTGQSWPVADFDPIRRLRVMAATTPGATIQETVVMAEDLSPATVGVVHRIMSGIFKSAVRDRRIASSPFEGTRLPKVGRARVEPLPTDLVIRDRRHRPGPVPGTGRPGGQHRIAAGRGTGADRGSGGLPAPDPDR